MSFRLLWVCLVISLWPIPHYLFAQDASQLAASMEILQPGVEVLRAGTVNWLPVKVEAIVGVGDTIRTDTTGRARITFFSDGTETQILPSSEYQIMQFEGSESSFHISVEVIAGQTIQSLSRILDANSSYSIQTPGMTLTARGTEFAIRVENSGRSGMLVSKGEVGATNEQADAVVPPGYGVRAESDAPLSDVVEATTFEQLDAAIDGCSATVRAPEEMSFNVRLGPNRDFQQIGTIEPAGINRLVGRVESGKWYRIEFQGGFGWILTDTATIEKGCPGLRRFADDYGPEDASLFSSQEVIPEATVTP